MKARISASCTHSTLERFLLLFLVSGANDSYPCFILGPIRCQPSREPWSCWTLAFQSGLLIRLPERPSRPRCDAARGYVLFKEGKDSGRAVNRLCVLNIRSALRLWVLKGA